MKAVASAISRNTASKANSSRKLETAILFDNWEADVPDILQSRYLYSMVNFGVIVAMVGSDRRGYSMVL